MRVRVGTILQQDSLDLLAQFMGKGDDVAALTTQAMDGSMNIEQVCAAALALFIFVTSCPERVLI